MCHSIWIYPLNVGVDVDVEHVELETDYPYYFKNGIIPSQYRRDEIQFSPFSSRVDRIQFNLMINAMASLSIL